MPMGRRIAALLLASVCVGAAGQSGGSPTPATVKIVRPAGGKGAVHFANADAGDAAPVFSIEHDGASELGILQGSAQVLSANSARVKAHGDLEVCGDLRVNTCGTAGAAGGGVNARLDKLEKETKTLAGCGMGDSAARPAASCLQVQAQCPWVASGPRWISIDGVKRLMYCDMETDMGGWTLVYSYGFTTPDDFDASANAVSVRPTWPTGGTVSAPVPVTKVAPTNTSVDGALDFAHWRNLGREFMVTSTIADWFVCTPGPGAAGGSLVDMQEGAIACVNVNAHIEACANAAAPVTLLMSNGHGPFLDNPTSHVYYWDASQASNWPTHDACGTNKVTHGDVPSVRGAIWLRDRSLAAVSAKPPMPALGLSRFMPTRSCFHLKMACPSCASGRYWIAPAESVAPQEMYCGMDDALEGGGWTLVYSYGFTDYANYDTGGNAVDPIPTWGTPSLSSADAARKTTTPPTAPGSKGAVDFGLWDSIGSSFLITSNIVDHYVCVPDSGSLTAQRTGSVTCRVAHDEVQPSCDPGDQPPDKITMNTGYGPHLDLSSSSHTVYWDGSTAANWPTHDPCSTNAKNHATGVTNPGGQIWLRPLAI